MIHSRSINRSDGGHTVLCACGWTDILWSRAGAEASYRLHLAAHLTSGRARGEAVARPEVSPWTSLAVSLLACLTFWAVVALVAL